MAPGKEQSKILNVNVSSGSGTGNITQTWDLCRRVRVIPPSESATYTFSILDGGGALIMKRSSQTGTFSDLDTISLGIAASVSIASASEDGTYSVRFDMH